jgi:hypothetical protein
MRRRLNYTHPTHPSRQRYTPQILRNQADGGGVYSCVWFCDNFPSSISASCVRLPSHTHYTHHTPTPVQPLGMWALSGFGKRNETLHRRQFLRESHSPPCGAAWESGMQAPAPVPGADSGPAAPAPPGSKKLAAPGPTPGPAFSRSLTVAALPTAAADRAYYPPLASLGTFPRSPGCFLPAGGRGLLCGAMAMTDKQFM